MAHLILAAVVAFCQHLAYADIYSFCGLRPPNPAESSVPKYPTAGNSGSTALTSLFRSPETWGEGGLGRHPAQGRSVAVNSFHFSSSVPPTMGLRTPLRGD